jgi:hypothetical protein
MSSHRARLAILVCLGLVLSSTGCLPPAGAPRTGRAAPEIVQRSVQTSLDAWVSRLPLYFVENRGQLDARVGYSVQSGAVTVYFTTQGVTFALVGPADQSGEPIHTVAGQMTERLPGRFSAAPASDLATAPAASLRWAIALDFVDASPATRPRGEDQTEATVSYFKGPKEEWKTGLPTFAAVRYQDVWPGIDLVYEGVDGWLKYTFAVRPGADPGRIALAYRGTTDVRLTEAGQLEVTTPVGDLRDGTPYAYQEIDGQRREVKTAYSLEARPEAGVYQYGFQVGAYDPDLPLVLDPAYLIYAGYIGGSGDEFGYDVTVDGEGYAYVAGLTHSAQDTFPDKTGPDLTHNGGNDAFVAKVYPSGTGLVYAGYIGGDSNDVATAIALKPGCVSNCDAYVAGFTYSTQATFPVTAGWPTPLQNGNIDAFVARVSPSGFGLVYAGYIGGAQTEEASGIAVDTAGGAYVVGFTQSDQTTFPVTGLGPDLGYNGGSQDAFVCKVNASGTMFVYCGYIGGALIDGADGIAVDGGGNAYVVGGTSSAQGMGFPLLVGPDLTHNGDFDAFVTKLTPSGGRVYSGYVGGSDYEVGHNIALLPGCAGQCEAYIVGSTESASFPATSGWKDPRLKTFNGGGSDAFVAKVSKDGTHLVYAGFIGGHDLDWGLGMAVDGSGNAYVAGTTKSNEASFPVKAGPDLSFNGDNDAFAAKLNVAGTELVYAGYVGGTGSDYGASSAVDSTGTAYIVGFTWSDQNEAFPVKVGPDLTHNGGGRDAFVAKIGWNGILSPFPQR